MKIVIALVSAALGVGLGFGALAEEPDQTGQGSDEVVVQLDCPEEDLCRPYYDGALDKWVVVQTPYAR